MSNPFPRFSVIYGPPDQTQPVETNQVEEYSGRLPDEILELWRQNGWVSYRNGLLWLTNPQIFKNIVPLFLPDHSEYLVFARTSFGDLFLWGDNRIYVLDAKYGRLYNKTSIPQIFFEGSLSRQDYMKDVLMSDVHEKAVKKLGIVDREEIYAFVPALSLGGNEKPENLQKLSMREHLAFLAQIDELQEV